MRERPLGHTFCGPFPRAESSRRDPHTYTGFLKECWSEGKRKGMRQWVEERGRGERELSAQG